MRRLDRTPPLISVSEPKLSPVATVLYSDAASIFAAGFEPEHLVQLQFYPEALDRDVRKPHEGPSIGVLLCATKDSEVVEYALSRTVSPALVAEYEPHLPDKNLLRAKLHEYYELAQARREVPAIEGPKGPAAKPTSKKRAGK
jgi:YhcG PDDEXK nuclease domain